MISDSSTIFDDVWKYLNELFYPNLWFNHYLMRTKNISKININLLTKKCFILCNGILMLNLIKIINYFYSIIMYYIIKNNR